jgi:predicted dehydrogenase
METIRVALIGCGKRARETFAPILRKMQPLVKLCAVMSRSEENAGNLGTSEGVPHYTSLEKLIEKEKPDCAIIVVSRSNHREPVETLCGLGVNMLIETPLAETRADMDAILAAASKSKSIIEIAEQYYRYPTALIMQKLIQSGIFGKINLVFSHSVGHGYHGIGLIRSFLGFEHKPVRVIGYSKAFPVVNHVWRAGEPMRDSENWQHGVIEFDNGSSGIYSFSSLTYGSPLRQDRLQNPFWIYGEKGMAMGHDAMYLEGVDQRVFVPIERCITKKNGLELLDAYVAKTKPEIVWENPLREHPLEEKELPVALCIWDAAQAVREKKAPPYGIMNGRTDRALELALIESWSNGNVPVIPL